MRGEYTQQPGSNPSAGRFCTLSLNRFDDPYEPPPGEATHYLVTWTDEVSCAEGALGDDSGGAERPNLHSCSACD